MTPDHAAEIMGGAVADAVREAVTAERARCAAVCREVARRERGHGDVVARMAAETCAEAIERGEAGR